MSRTNDFRTQVAPATQELRKLREEGYDLNAALDALKSKGFVLPAVVRAIQAVDGLSSSEVKRLFDARGD